MDQFDCVCSCDRCGPLNLHDCGMAACSGLWKPVASPGWEHLYEVSNRGKVRSLRRKTRSGWRGGKLIGTYVRHDGYPEAQLCGGSQKRLKRMVHLLVLEAFVGLCPEGMEALHGPGGKLDASLANLSWGTREKNTGEDRVRDHQSNRGERHGLTTLTWDQVCNIRALIGKVPQNELARLYGVSKQTITNIKQGKTWAYPPEEW